MWFKILMWFLVYCAVSTFFVFVIWPKILERRGPYNRDDDEENK